MWLSSYLIHWERVDWREAAKWMHDLLLDGDEASNTLSWQWVASTFGSKPYFFNQENLSKYTDNQLCKNCQATCPFKHSYESLNAALFEPSTAPAKISAPQHFPATPKVNGTEAIILFHDEMLSPTNPLYQRKERKVFIFDEYFYKDWALKRLQFLAECLAEMPEVEIWAGDRIAVLKLLDAGHIETQMTPNTALRKQLSVCNVTYVAEQSIYPEIVKEKLTQKGVIRFSKYWNEVGAEVLRRE
jgi:deoxyribodipyrimidine photo-lyase